MRPARLEREGEQLPRNEAKSPDPDRIDVTDTPANAVFKLVKGDHAAAEACIQLVRAVA